jgi:DNA polymerase-1
LNIPIEALNDTHPDHEKFKKKFKAERTKAKVITFGLAYGKGAFGFSKDFGISEDEAKVIVDKYFEGMPGLKKAIDDSHREVERCGYVTYLSGRRRHFTKIKTENWEGYSKKNLRQAFNAKIQGFSADMIRIALNNVLRASHEQPELGIRIHATVHDEIVCSCDSYFLEQSKKVIKTAMETAVTFCVPVISDIGTGTSYAEAK